MSTSPAVVVRSETEWLHSVGGSCSSLLLARGKAGSPARPARPSSPRVAPAARRVAAGFSGSRQHGITHAEIGAHLLALWGLPHTVTEAVAGHHDNNWLNVSFDTVAAVQIANVLVEELEAEHTTTACPASELDPDYLEQAGLAARLPHWRELAANQFHAHSA